MSGYNGIFFLQVVDYLPAITTEHLRAYMKAKEKTNPFQFLRPFSTELWVLIIVMVVVFALSFYFTSKLHQDSGNTRLTLISR